MSKSAWLKERQGIINALTLELALWLPPNELPEHGALLTALGSAVMRHQGKDADA